MTPISSEHREQLIGRILALFGTHESSTDRHLFDQIITLPQHYSDQRLSRTEFTAELHRLRFDSLALILDTSPNSAIWSAAVSARLGAPGVFAGYITLEELEGVLDEPECDCLLCNAELTYIAAPCHEDFEIDGQRSIWRAIAG